MTIIPLKTEFDEMNRMRKLSSLSLITEEYYYQNILNEDKRYDWLYGTYKDKFFNKFKHNYGNTYSDDEKIKLIEPNLNALIKGDPISKIENEQIIKTGKYSQWIVKQYLLDQTGRFFEDLYKITNDLKYFDRLKHRLPEDKRDINQIKDPFELYELIKPFKQLDIRKKAEKKGDIITLLDDEDYHILIPKTKEASCTYGEGTRWCTASPGLHYFEDYTASGPLYIIIHKKETDKNDVTQDRFQFHFERNQFMDIDDKEINLENYMENHPKVQQVFKNIFVKEKNIKNLITIGEVETAWELLNKDLSKFDKKSSFILYNKGLIGDKEINKKWGRQDEVFKNKSLFYITDDGWCDESLSKLFHDDYQKFAHALLCGDSYNYFDGYYDYLSDLIDIWDRVDDENLKKIQELSIGKTTDDGIKITKSIINKISKVEKPKFQSGKLSLYDLVDDNEEWEEIKHAIQYSVADAQQSADEGAYYEAYTELIQDKLGKTIWKNNKLYIHIEEYDDWIERFKEIYPEEDEHDWSIMDIIKEVLSDNGYWIRPREQYYGGWEDNYFNERLYDKLYELK